MTPPYSRLAYRYSDESRISSAGYNPQSNCNGGRRLQNRVNLIDWTLGLSEVPLILNLETNEVSLDVTKLPCNIERGYCDPTALNKATIVWEPETHCRLFKMIRFDAFMVKYQKRYWIETNADRTLVQELNKNNHTKVNKSTSQIATGFGVYSKFDFHCGSTKPIYSTEYEDIYIIHEKGFDMNTGKSLSKNINTFENEVYYNTIRRNYKTTK